MKNWYYFYIIVVFLILIIPYVEKGFSFERMDISVSELEKMPSEEFALLNVSIVNKNKENFEDIKITLTSPYSIVKQEPNWPSIIYGNSSISGIYSINSDNAGNHSIWLTSSYIINETNIGIRQFTDSYLHIMKVGEYSIKLNEFWLGVTTTILGDYQSGSVLPELGKSISNYANSRRSKKQSISEIKHLLLTELSINLENIKREEPTLDNNWRKTISMYSTDLVKNKTLHPISIDYILTSNL